MSSKSTIMGTCLLLVGQMTMLAQGQIMEWRPVGSTGQDYCGGLDPDTGTCANNEILNPERECRCGV